MVFVLTIVLIGFENTLSSNPFALIPMVDFSFPSPSINYERRISRNISLYEEFQPLNWILSEDFDRGIVPPQGFEFGLFEYIEKDFEGLFLSQGIEYTMKGFFRIPINIGYKWIYKDSYHGFSVRIITGLTVGILTSSAVEPAVEYVRSLGIGILRSDYLREYEEVFESGYTIKNTELRSKGLGIYLLLDSLFGLYIGYSW